MKPIDMFAGLFGGFCIGIALVSYLSVYAPDWLELWVGR